LLHLTKKLVNLLGCNISVKSEYGTAGGKKMKILVVDDKKENLYLLEELLKGSGYEVTSAANGAEALEKLHANGFNMIISDILMPVMDGYQLCREVKGTSELKDIPFIFYTATYTDEKDEKLAIRLGADRFLRKPEQWDDLLKTIQDVIRDVKKGRAKKPKTLVLEDDKKIYKLYSERLVKKLEKKMLDLEREITERERAEEERKKLQSQLQQTQRLEAIGTLAGGIAHDFNNILSVILGYTELALVDMDKKTKLYGHLEAVFEAGKKARDLVKQILTFSRQDEQEFISIQLKPIIKEALKLFRFSMFSQVELKLDIQSESMILADPTQLHQVFLNLCTNANHAMQEKGGVLDVRLEDVELCADVAARYPDVKPGSYVKLTVSDTGHGMPAEVLERIYDPFFTTKAKDGGTGMGLSVVHGIVKNHGGTITVYSEPGEGATFNIFLPVDKTGAEPDAKNKKTSPKGTECILFIDDEQNLVKTGKQMLESLGYKVTTKTSSVEALKLFKSQPEMFDLVITDMMMPSMTGEELAKEVLVIRPDIPVILCTGFNAKIDKKKAKALGFRAYILKPVLKRQMAETIREVLDSQKEKEG